MSQHLIEVTASNFKRLTAVHIKPDAPNGVLRISGENEAGKSAVLDALAAVFKGKKHIPEAPIHRGARKAEILAETEDYVITRTFTAKGGSITVKDREGRQYSSPQTLLDNMSSTLGFDPEAFARMGKQKQAEALLAICPVGIDLNENQRLAGTAYDERRDHARDLKTLEARLEGMPKIEDTAPESEVSVGELTRKLITLQGQAQDYKDLLGGYTEKEVAAKEANQAVVSAQVVLMAAEKAVETAEHELEDAQHAVTEAEDPADKITAVQSKIDGAEEENQRFRAAKARRDLMVDVNTTREMVKMADARLEGLRTERADALKAAKFPVPELSLDDEGVTLDGLPFSQAADSRKIKVGLALALTGNPELRLVFIRNGSLLDHKSMKALDEMAAEYDVHILIERVDDTSPGVIEIVDGSTTEEK